MDLGGGSLGPLSQAFSLWTWDYILEVGAGALLHSDMTTCWSILLGAFQEE